MNIAIKHSSINENTLIWAIVASFLLHVLLAVVLPNFKFEVAKVLRPELKVELVQPKKEVPPEVTPAPEKPVLEKPVEPPKPLPKKPEPIKKTVEPKPLQKPIEIAENPPPAKLDEPAPAIVSETPKVIAVEPTAEPTPEAAPVEIVKAPEPKPVAEKAPEPSQDDIDSALGAYGGQLGRAIAKHKQYPKIAQMRGWQGEVVLDLKIDGSGNVLSAKVRESSGHDALDNQALEMARKASPFPAPPQALRNRTFDIKVPVSFRLEPA